MPKAATAVQQRIRPAPPPQVRCDPRMPVRKQVQQDRGSVETIPAPTVRDHWDYGLDVWQRTVLFWNALRQRRQANALLRITEIGKDCADVCVEFDKAPVMA